MEQVLLVAFIGILALIAIGQSAHHTKQRHVKFHAPPLRSAQAKQEGTAESAARGSAHNAASDKERPTP